MLERIFKLRANGTTIRTELVAGLTTFMTMAYILFVNPSILEAAGLPRIPTIAATAIGAAIPTILMGLYSNYPFALASGMGLNAVVAFTIVRGMHLPWETAMGVVFVEGVITTVLVLTRVQEAVIDAIPMSLKRSIGVGIGLLVAYLGMKQAGLVVGSPDTLTTFGSLRNTSTLVSSAGLLLIIILMAWRISGAILIGIIGTTLLAMATGIAHIPERWMGMPEFSTFGRLDIAGALRLSLAGTIFAFLITDFFGTLGTVIGVGGQAGYLDENGRLPRLNRVLLVGSLSVVWGSLCSASSVTTFVESASGISVGGRTGLTSVTTGLIFLISIFFAPAMGIVPAAATAPALIVVGFLLIEAVRDIPFDDLDEALPAFITIIVIPLTLSITRGVGYGFVTYTFLKLLRGKWKEINPLMAIIALLFILSFIIQG